MSEPPSSSSSGRRVPPPALTGGVGLHTSESDEADDLLSMGGGLLDDHTNTSVRNVVFWRNRRER